MTKFGLIGATALTLALAAPAMARDVTMLRAQPPAQWFILMRTTPARHRGLT